jgi:hypothetical protein
MVQSVFEEKSISDCYWMAMVASIVW